MSTPYRIAFTGHRSSDLPGRTTADLEAVRGFIRGELKKISIRPAVFCSSVAEGADTIACEEALACGLPLEVHLPLPPGEFREDFHDRIGAWTRTENLIEIAGSFGHQLHLPGAPLPRPRCYAKVNEQLLEHANLLIAVTTDSPEQSGGASEMLTLAQRQRIPCIVIDPLTHLVMRV